MLAHGEGKYAPSLALLGRKDDEFLQGPSEIRTAWNTWCDEACASDEVVQRITARIEAVTGVPRNNSEPIQFLRYLACPDANASHPDCQFYKRHSDWVPEMLQTQPGPRVYTFFLYLSDVEEGGGTLFDAGFTVQPAAGRAVLWPSVRNEEPFVQEERTHHEALPVLRGVKYAANYWIHQFDYRTSSLNGCTQ